MNIEITARHYEASERIKNYLTEEMKKIEMFDHLISSCKIILEKSKEGEMTEITLHALGKDLVSAETSDDMIKSIDLAVAKMERQLKRFKEKRYAH
jgi:putative sigma-54 modulation protein